MTASFEVQPIGHVLAARERPEDDFWGGTRARIRLAGGVDASALDGLDAFSHAEIVFLFDRVTEEKIVTGARHPRDNTAWPRIGIFAQRGKNRPNRLGTTICRVCAVTGRELEVEELDAIDGTPVLDIKPVLREFLPRDTVTQPPWVSELMVDYWKAADE